MAFFDQVFGGQGGAPGLGAGGSAFSPNGVSGGLSPQLMALLTSLQNRSTPGAGGGGATPAIPGPPQMPQPPSGALEGMNPMGAAGLATVRAGIPAGAAGAPGQGQGLMQMLMANPLLMRAAAQGKGGPGAMPGAGAGGIPGPGTGGLY